MTTAPCGFAHDAFPKDRIRVQAPIAAVLAAWLTVKAWDLSVV